MKKRIVFLYTELAEYIKTSMDALAEKEVEVHVFHYPVNPEAPFKFDFENSRCEFYLRTRFSRAELIDEVKKINPQAIVCSGWIDKDYVSICHELRPKVKTIIALDNQLEKGLKPRLARERAKRLFKPAFDFAWVPGNPQVKYAEKLGFKPNEIQTGFYTIDVKKWNQVNGNNSTTVFPKRFVFVGRYMEFKGVIELWEAYSQIDSKGWELYCAGNGDLYPSRRIQKGIHHIGFVQPVDLHRFVAQGGVFILPSHKEPWGVVVHEFAAAGYPIICTENVGAASAFLEDGINGYVIKSNDLVELKGAMNKIIAISDQELFKMGQESKRLASQIDIDAWVNTAIQFIEERN